MTATPRVYLDWNASAPLRPEARAAMLAAMDAVGNPSSVHSEGRAARAIVEKARAEVAGLVGCDAGEVVFTSGATEAASMALSGVRVFATGVEHECVDVFVAPADYLPVERCGTFAGLRFAGRRPMPDFPVELRPVGTIPDAFLAIQSANSETGVLQPVQAICDDLDFVCTGNTFVDAAQAFGKCERVLTDGAFHALSSCKIGGGRGAGALISRWNPGDGRREPKPLIRGGGQERNRRAGTENVIGIAGFGAAAAAAKRDLEAGVWEKVAALRDRLEDRLVSAAEGLHVVGAESPRLPNTSCLMVPGWAGETQVIQMDLAGFAVSAGSACSSGKVEKASRVLRAMGFDEVSASSAIRVSIGPTTTEAEVMAFADAWVAAWRRRPAEAA